MHSRSLLALIALILGACASPKSVESPGSSPLTARQLLAVGCPHGGAMVTAVGELEFSDETARSRLLDEADASGRRPGISVEHVPVIAQKKELFEGNEVAVTGKLRCELGPDRNADGLPLFGSIVDVSEVKVLRGIPR